MGKSIVTDASSQKSVAKCNHHVYHIIYSGTISHVHPAAELSTDYKAATGTPAVLHIFACACIYIQVYRATGRYSMQAADLAKLMDAGLKEH